MIIKEQDIELTRTQKTLKSLGNSPILFFPFLVLGSILSLILPFFIALIIFVVFIIIFLVLLKENVIEKYFYKLIGKQKDTSTSNQKNPYSNLPISIKFQFIYEIEGCIEKLKNKYNLNDDDFNETDVSQIITEPNIAELNGKYFNCQSIVFQDKLFVTEVIFPEFKTKIGFIDTTNLTYNVIKEFNTGEVISFKTVDKELQISWREPNLNKLISVI